MDSPVEETGAGERHELRDATNVKNEAVAAQAAEHGWVKPSIYDYSSYAAAEKPSSANRIPEATANEETGQNTTDVPVWASDAARYEWKEEYGEVGPAVESLERQLFGNPERSHRGENMRALQLEVVVESERVVRPIKSFEDAGLHPVMLENVKLCKYETPTPIQAYCVPAILTNHDIIAVAQTGSGKTAAFLIPVLSKLMGKAKKLAAPRPDPSKFFDARINGVVAEPLVLVITPTRELSCQIFDEARRFCYRSMLRPCVAYGGGPAREQAYELKRGCDILIGTPGRLIDFINRGNILSLRRVKYTIIDEADELIGPDWMDDMKQILSGGDNNEDADHRYMLFSATFPKEARALAKEYLDDSHVRIRVGRVGSTHLNIRQTVVHAEESQKRETLRTMLLDLPPTRTIIFVNSKKSADYLDDFLYNCGFPSTSLHSDRTQREREDALRAFKSGKAPILVATGVSARGLDISNIMHVVNYDLPSVEHGGIQEYVHRIGRTARIGHVGLATSLYNERNEDLAPMLVKTLMETGHEVPDFLEQFKPAEGEPLDFEDDSDAEGADDAANGAVANGGDAWGTEEASGGGGAWGSGDASGGGDAWGTGDYTAPTAIEESSW